MTNDVDAILLTSSEIKRAANQVGDKFNLGNGWLNSDFKNTDSYSNKLIEVSKHYRTFSNVLNVRTIADEYLVAMKLMSGRRYKYDLSDVVGILHEHNEKGNPISIEEITNAFNELYGEDAKMPESSSQLLKEIEATNNRGKLKELFLQTRKNEEKTKEMILKFQEEYPNTITKGNFTEVVENLLRKATNKLNPPTR